MRDNRDDFPDWYVGFVGFCASYKAKFFGGYANGSPTKEGLIRYYADEAIRNLKRQRELLSGIPFVCCDYRNWENTRNAVIYCDPPYRGTTQYSGGNFDSDRFFDWCRIMGRHNIVLISEYGAPDGFFEVDSFAIHATLGCGQAEHRADRIFTTGMGCELFRDAIERTLEDF